jgi:DNA mismatch repair protein MutS
MFQQEFLTAQGSAEYIDKLLQNFSPSEVLIQKKKREFKEAFFGEDFHNFIWKIGFSRLCL